MNGSDFVPSIDEILRITQRREDENATDNSRGRMRKKLELCSYRPDNEQVFEAILEYGARELDGRNVRGLFLRGDCGIGKTLGCKILSQAFKFPFLTAKTLQQIFMKAKDEDEFWGIVDGRDFHGHPHTIVIDDLGTEDHPVMKFGTQHFLMADVLERRYSQGYLKDEVRTIVTSNLDDGALLGRYGRRISDRLNEMCNFVSADGRSLR